MKIGVVKGKGHGSSNFPNCISHVRPTTMHTLEVNKLTTVQFRRSSTTIKLEEEDKNTWFSDQIKPFQVAQANYQTRLERFNIRDVKLSKDPDFLISWKTRPKKKPRIFFLGLIGNQVWLRVCKGSYPNFFGLDQSTGYVTRVLLNS